MTKIRKTSYVPVIHLGTGTEAFVQDGTRIFLENQSAAKVKQAADQVESTLSTYPTITDVQTMINSSVPNVDLSKYYTKSQTQSTINVSLFNYYNKTQIDSKLSNYTTTTQVEQMISAAMNSSNKPYANYIVCSLYIPPSWADVNDFYILIFGGVNGVPSRLGLSIDNGSVTHFEEFYTRRYIKLSAGKHYITYYFDDIICPICHLTSTSVGGDPDINGSMTYDSIYELKILDSKFNSNYLWQCDYAGKVFQQKGFVNIHDTFEIPPTQFYGNTSLYNASALFHTNPNLLQIPPNIFKRLPLVTVMNSTFSGCSSLTSVPENLFQYFVNLQDVSYCFYNCKNITSAVPDLWNTTKYPNIVTFTKCFYGCTKASNYADIPAGWK